MALYLREVMKAVADGRQHYHDVVVTQKKEPVTPSEYVDGPIRRWFATGFVEAMRAVEGQEDCDGHA